MNTRRFLHLPLAAAALASALWLPAARAHEAPPAQAERHRQFIAGAFAQWAAGGRSFFQDVLAPDAVWTIKGTSPVAGTYRGRQDFLDRAVKPFADRMATPVQPVVRDIWASGNDVVVHWDGTATAGDGAPYRNSYVWIFRMGDRQAREVVAFLDLVPYDDVLRRVTPPAARP